MTMLREAARSLKTFSSLWSINAQFTKMLRLFHCLWFRWKTPETKTKSHRQASQKAMGMIRDVMGTIAERCLCSRIPEGTLIKVGADDLRYLSPSEIQDDPDVRVIFFKTSLNTGWDCPRAEVMMSFRAAADSTFIAQLVEGWCELLWPDESPINEILNTVALYLPITTPRVWRR